MENKISADINVDMVKKVTEMFSEIQKNLPFLINLTNEERVSMLKLGDKSLAFVQTAYQIAKRDDSFLPRNFDVNEFKKDVDAYLHLHNILQIIELLHKKVEDTYMLAGSEAYAGALVVYDRAKKANTGGSLDTLIDDLSKRFIRKQKNDELGGPKETV